MASWSGHPLIDDGPHESIPQLDVVAECVLIWNPVVPEPINNAEIAAEVKSIDGLGLAPPADTILLSVLLRVRPHLGRSLTRYIHLELVREELTSGESANHYSQQGR
jgi:hypothetical protein